MNNENSKFSRALERVYRKLNNLDEPLTIALKKTYKVELINEDYTFPEEGAQGQKYTEKPKLKPKLEPYERVCEYPMIENPYGP